MSDPLPPTLRADVAAWILGDPDPATAAELEMLLAAADDGDAAATADLEERFSAGLTFGTAGLRGAIGAGPNRMNLAVVIRTAAGLAAWLHGDGGRIPAVDGEPGADPADVGERGVVIGFDARHRSADFAGATASVLAAAGIRALVLPGPLPTPVLAFAVRHLGCAAGVMVTASHNPAADNGYKVYDASGRQVVPPSDHQISAAECLVVRSVPLAPADDARLVALDDEVVAAYVERAAAVGVVPDARKVELAYTALHGVGSAVIRRVFAAAGFPPLNEVPEQAEPDPDFPTVAFPNPEEPGALDLVTELARDLQIRTVIANDPDADRLAVAVSFIPTPEQLDRGIKMGCGEIAHAGFGVLPGHERLSGDQLGVVLADHLLRHDAIGPDDVLATTIVSSSLLGKMAAAAGRPYVETLTGFKWVGRAPGPGRRLGFGYEEALGYCVGGVIADKDGITAAVLFAEAVAELADEGLTVFDVLDRLHLEHGVHHTIGRAYRVDGTDGPARMAAAVDRLRAEPPRTLGGASVVAVQDLARGDAARNLPATDAVVLSLEGVADPALVAEASPDPVAVGTMRVVVRPSGTEPKLKAYIEVVEPRVDHLDLQASRARAAATADHIAEALRALITPTP